MPLTYKISFVSCSFPPDSFTFDIENQGDIDAKLNSVSGMTETKSGVTKTVKCADATPTAGTAAFELAKKTGTTAGSISCVMDISFNRVIKAVLDHCTLKAGNDQR